MRKLLALAAATALLASAPPAQAAGGGRLIHGNDAGYDPAIVYGCGGIKFLPENRSALGSGCPDVNRVYVRRGEEIWCRTISSSGLNWWGLTYDGTGWHAYGNSANRECTLRKD